MSPVGHMIPVGWKSISKISTGAGMGIFICEYAVLKGIKICHGSSLVAASQLQDCTSSWRRQVCTDIRTEQEYFCGIGTGN